MIKVSFTKNELLVIREAMHSITIKGSDAVLVGATLEKIYKAIDDAEGPVNSDALKSKRQLTSNVDGNSI